MPARRQSPTPSPDRRLAQAAPAPPACARSPSPTADRPRHRRARVSAASIHSGRWPGERRRSPTADCPPNPRPALLAGALGAHLRLSLHLLALPSRHPQQPVQTRSSCGANPGMIPSVACAYNVRWDRVSERISPTAWPSFTGRHRTSRAPPAPTRRADATHGILVHAESRGPVSPVTPATIRAESRLIVAECAADFRPRHRYAGTSVPRSLGDNSPSRRGMTASACNGTALAT